MTEPSCKHGWIMPASQCPDCADIFRMEAKIESLEAECLIVRELIDGCMEVIETWGETPYQKKWSKEWVIKARKVLGNISA